MKYSGIGGQAVMEGVMMRSGDRYAVAVRKTDGEIAVNFHKQKHTFDKVRRIPIVRGVVAFFESLVMGISTLFESADYFDEEATENPEEKKEKNKAAETAEMVGTLLLSFVIALVVFLLFPYYLSKLFGRFVSSESVQALIEGILRVLIFIVYLLVISKMEDIRRVFQYHGAEHKCINCIENGRELTVENVRESSRFHRRCGTSFLFFVVLLSIFFFMFIRSDSHLMQLLYRFLLIPVIAGISYEFIRIAGRSSSRVVQILSKPGLMLQSLTTREPDDSMIEVGIASVEAVFDWKSFLYPDPSGPDEREMARREEN